MGPTAEDDGTPPHFRHRLRAFYTNRITGLFDQIKKTKNLTKWETVETKKRRRRRRYEAVKGFAPRGPPGPRSSRGGRRAAATAVERQR